MNWNDILTNTIGGLIGGGVVAIALQIYNNKREKLREKNSKIIKSKNSEKRITDSIFWDLKPGNSIELMKELLGTYIRKSNSDFTVFKEEEIKTNSYLYILGNAYIKITSKDDETIDSLTVFPFGAEFHLDSIANVCDENENRFNVMKVCQQMIDLAEEHTYIGTRTDSSFALKIYFPNPLYQNYTYFGYAENSYEYFENKNKNIFLGGIINGICISNNTDDVFFIYDQETR